MKSFITLTPLLCLLQLSSFVSAWSYTYYIAPWTTSDSWNGNITTTTTVCPTGSIAAPTSTSTSTGTTTIDVFYENNRIGTLYETDKTSVTVSITNTYLYLPPHMPVTAAASLGFMKAFMCHADRPQATRGLETQYYAPVVISNPASCTLTGFLYTTVYSINLGPAQLLAQGMSSPNVELVTAVTQAKSTDLGGQAIQTSYTAVYLNAQAFGSAGLTIHPNEYSYLTECVDPRRYTCSSAILASPGGCPITEVPYPPVATSTGESSVGRSRPSQTQAAGAKQTGGVIGKKALFSEWIIYLTLTMMYLNLI
ncbi:hypothetical protein CNMCM5623_002705 [Aspergillus felis]|uniref:Uncharacterized protein n=1 Tax=Aspergillus felis TaxID=1287682 RepID=A0A8H6QCN5_9EURO|nr:hypothetical protein CNMCM5623_002705 [Aspergillus felis]